jgi:hypothetical protein
MIALSELDLIQIWESGLPQPCALRACTILEHGFPELAGERLTRMSLGERDARLLALRNAAFGCELDCLGHCPTCAHPLELRVDGRALAAGLQPPGTGGEPLRCLQDGDYSVEYRLPNVADSCELARVEEPHLLRDVMFARCVRSAWLGEEPVKPAALPPALQARIEADMEEWDPDADIRLTLSCPACERQTSVSFDVAAFFWTEIELAARGLLDQVHGLAAAYGWGEDAILRMSPWRRQQYLTRLEA